jgi:YD repeat-containing protein
MNMDLKKDNNNHQNTAVFSFHFKDICHRLLQALIFLLVLQVISFEAHAIYIWGGTNPRPSEYRPVYGRSAQEAAEAHMARWQEMLEPTGTGVVVRVGDWVSLDADSGIFAREAKYPSEEGWHLFKPPYSTVRRGVIKPYYITSPESQSPTCNSEADPCDPANGKVFLSETDVISGSHGLTFTRYYQSIGIGEQDASFGINWRHSFSRNMNGEASLASTKNPPQSPRYGTPEDACTEGWLELRSEAFRGMLQSYTAVQYTDGLCRVIDGDKTLASLPVYTDHVIAWMSDEKTHENLNTFLRPSGQVHYFGKVADSWVSLDDGSVSLQQTGDEWLLKNKDDSIERYGADKKLLSTTDRSGRVTNYGYLPDGNLATITNSFGDEIVLTHTDSRISAVTGADGTVSYSYDALGNLTLVTFPDQSTREYRYENTQFPYHLTSLIDENGNQYASWSYDDKGRVIVNKQAGETARHTFTYNSNGTTTVIDAKGASRTYEFQVVQGSLKIKNVIGDKCKNCPGGSIQARTYDVNGYPSSSTDWNGNVTTYVHDDTGRELSRTEAFGTPQQRTISTDWHTTFRLPAKITEPDKITEYTYDSQGRLLTKQQRPVQ